MIIEGEIIAYLRIIPDVVPAIGRVVVRQDYRRKGYARKLMQKAIEITRVEFDRNNIKLQAQYYLLEFYEKPWLLNRYLKFILKITFLIRTCCILQQQVNFNTNFPVRT